MTTDQPIKAESHLVAFDFSQVMTARERSLGRLMWRLKAYSDAYIEGRLQELGFQDFKVSYLRLLANIREEGTTNNELARNAGVTKQAMSKVVALLEKEDYIYIQKHEKDSRSGVIFLNDRGKQLLLAVFQSMNEVRQHFSAIVGEEKMAAMIETMVAIDKGLDGK